MSDKIYSSFNRFYNNVYLREQEILEIKSFLNSKKNVLHICGKPGTGKTLIIKHLIKNLKNVLYFNSLTEENKIKSFLTQRKCKIFIIDEYDKFELRNKELATKIINNVIKNKKKLITISNYLTQNENILFFKPYTTKQIEEIIVKKIENEIKENVLSSIDIKLISKRCSSGDLREVYEYVLNEICKRSQSIQEENTDIHKEIIKKLINSSQKNDKKKLYEEYLNECDKLKYNSYERGDFNYLFDLLS